MDRRRRHAEPECGGRGAAAPVPLAWPAVPDDSHPCYLRFPSVRGDALTFVADDDVWLVASTGGTARRLTADRAPAAFPVLSPDGTRIAFTSQRDGTPEAFVVATDGSDLRRLTYFGDPTTRTIGWDDDRRVLVVSGVGEPFTSRTWAYAISVDGTDATRLPYGPVSAIARGPGRATVLGVNQSLRRGAAWKRYRGGTAAALWIDPLGDSQFVPFLRELAGQLEDPAVVGDRLVFISDHEGVGNVYSVDVAKSAAVHDAKSATGLGGVDLRRHTDHADFYARAASSDGRTVVYQSAGQLFRLDDLARDSVAERIDITLAAPRSGRAPRVLRAGEALGAFAVDHDGRASAVEVRGEVHWLTHAKGPARLLAGGGPARARLPQVAGTGDARRVVVVTDAQGDDALEITAVRGAPPAAPRRVGAGSLGRVLELAVSPDGTRAAVAAHDGRVLLVDLEAATFETIARSDHGDATGLRFSPDSRLLAWSHAGPEPLRQIKLADLATGTERPGDGGRQGRDVTVLDATPLRFVDETPAFSTDGRFLAFLSARTFDPLYDAHVFDLSFVAGTRPYLLTLSSRTPSPFDPELEGRPRPGEGAPPGDKSGGDGGSAAPDADAAAPDAGAAAPDAGGEGTHLDVEGLTDRVVPFPVDAGRFSSLASVDGGFAWLSMPLAGVLGEGRAALDAPAPRASLVRFDLAANHQTVLVDALDGFEVSGDGKTIVVRDGPQLRAVAAGHRAGPTGSGGEADPDVVDVDLGRVRVEIDPPVEWGQMYEEAARLMRDHYWIADMAGVDWDALVARYRPLLDQVATRDDLSEVLWELQGELGSSHAYEMPPPRPLEDERRLGHLGADLARDEQGAWVLRRVLAGESSVLGARSPLRAPAVALEPGDAIVHVDGKRVDARRGPAASLVGAANRPVVLGIRARDGRSREVVVQPLSDERPLRYQAWVAATRAQVHETTGGRVGYLHIPDMMGYGWAELHRDLRAEVARDALVVDVRDNRGGHVSSLVLETIGRTVQAWVTARHRGTDTYPEHALRGPRILLVNEHAGSDGDIVTAAFRQRRLGPVVGTRTWGGVIGIDSRYQLVDGTQVTQPRYAFWFYGLGWDVENHGVDPDVEVRMAPQDWAAGRDPQLERAIELVLAALDEHPAATPPDPATRPDRSIPPLPLRP